MKYSVPMSMIFFLASVFAVGPFAMDAYIPAIPSVAADLGVMTSQVALTVSIFMFSFSIGQLIGGPTSDKLGRRKVIVFGLTLFALGSLCISQVHSLELLYFWRVVQALGGGIAGVCAPAIIRDIASGREAAKLFSLIGLIMMLAPSLAPTIGTLIFKLLSWRWLFVVIALFAAVVAINALRMVPKRSKNIENSANEMKFFDSFMLVFRTRKALPFLMVQAVTFSILMIFLTNSPAIYIEKFGASEIFFAFVFIVNTGGNVLMNRLNAYLLNSYAPEKLLKGFVLMQFTGTLTLLCSQLFFPENFYLIMLAFFISLSSAGGIIGNTNACFMSYFPKNAGAAAGIFGATQSMVAASIGALSAIFFGYGIWALALLMLVINLIALNRAFYGARHSLEGDLDEEVSMV